MLPTFILNILFLVLFHFQVPGRTLKTTIRQVTKNYPMRISQHQKAPAVKFFWNENKAEIHVSDARI